MCSCASWQQYPKHVGNTRHSLYGGGSADVSDGAETAAGYSALADHFTVALDKLSLGQNKNESTMKRCMTFSRVLRHGVHHTFDFLMSVFNRRVTDVLCYCYTVSIKHLEATAVQICFYINAFEFTVRLFHCVRITFLFQRRKLHLW